MSKGSTEKSNMQIMQDCVKSTMSKYPNKSKDECVQICRGMMAKSSIEERRAFLKNINVELPEGLLSALDS